jgi:hypothetical protein
MTTLKDTAQAYEPKRTLNIADLASFDISEPIEERTGKDGDGKEFANNVLIRDGKDYRVPATVLKSIKAMLEAYAESGKTVSTFKVTKTGEGMNTEYTTLCLD